MALIDKLEIDAQTAKEWWRDRGDHYFGERIRLESAARLLAWKLEMGADTAEALADVNAVLTALHLFDLPLEWHDVEPAPTKLHMMAVGKIGPAFQARMEGVV